MKKTVRSLFGVCLVGPLLVGCVPYQTYQQTKLDLEKALSTNADLVKKYNRLMQKLLAGGEGSGEDVDALMARLAKAESDYANLQAEWDKLPGFTREEIESIGLGVEFEGGGARLGEALLFNSGSDKLKPEAFRVLDGLASLLRRHPNEDFIIEGHTDNQPLEKTRGLHHTNMNLGLKRALAVFNYFNDNNVVPENRMVVVSQSFRQPIDPATANTTAGRAANRRVVVRLNPRTTTF